MKKRSLLNCITVIAALLTTTAFDVKAQCTAPTGLSATAASITTASISWSGSGAVNWEIEYGPVGYTQGTGTTTTSGTTSATLTLATNLVHDVYVRKNCGSGVFSSWAGPVTAHTLEHPCDDFDVYPTGQLFDKSILVEQWNGIGGGLGEISTDYASSPPNSLKIQKVGVSESDYVAPFGPYTSGVHSIKVDFYIPSPSSGTNYGGYYNILHHYTGPTNVWAIEVYMGSNGVATVNEGSIGTGVIGTYNFNIGSWNTLEHIINLDEDTAFIKINGAYTTVGWKFSLGSTNYGNQVNAFNFYSAANVGDTPLMYFDNFCVSDAHINDVGMNSFVPLATPICGDSNFPVEAVIQNFGENKLTGFDVEVDITGTSTSNFTYTYNGSLLPGQLDTVVLGTYNNISGGLFNATAETQLSVDTVPANNLISINNVPITPGVTVYLPQDTFYCTNNYGFELELNAYNSGNTITWHDGSSNPIFTVDTSGQFWVEVSNSFGCTDSDTLNVSLFTAPDVNLGNDINYCEGEAFTANLFAAVPGTTILWSTGETSQQIMIDTAGIYWVDVQNTDGCIDRDSVIVSENPLPELDLEDVHLCSGDIATLDAGNPGSDYQWNVIGEDNQTLDVQQSGMYSVTVTTAAGCAGSASLFVLVFPKPVIDLGEDVVLGEGETVTLDAGSDPSYDTYSWSTGASSQTITVANPGTYSVTVTTFSDCEGIDEVEVTSNVGIASLVQGHVRLYPNPSNANTMLEISPKAAGQLKMEFFGVNGQKVKEISMPLGTGKSVLPIETTSLSKGVYLISVSLDGESVSNFRFTKM